MAKKKKAVKSRRPKANKAAKSRRPKAKKTINRSKARRRVASKKRVKKRVGKSKKATASLPEFALEKIGEITHYFPHVNAAAVKILKSGLRAGDQIYIKGHTTDFKEKVDSIQLDHVPISEARKGQEIGMSVRSRVRIGDSVYRV